MKICQQCQHSFATQGWACSVCGYQPPKLDGFYSHAPDFAHGGGGFKAEYFEALAKLEAKNFWFRARNELLIRAMRRYKPSASSFLEIGCGTGFVLSGLSRAYPDMKLSGTEIFLAGLSYAAARLPTACLMQMDAREIPFSDEFDAVGAFDVLEHIEEDELVLSQVYRALKPGGILLMTVPQHAWLWSAADEYACHVRRYTARDLHEKVRCSGFQIERSTSFVSLLLPAMMLSRKKNPVATDYDPLAELSLSNTLNSVFMSIMRLEGGLIRAGLSFPCGGSRLLVARKPSSLST